MSHIGFSRLECLSSNVRNVLFASHTHSECLSRVVVLKLCLRRKLIQKRRIIHATIEILHGRRFVWVSRNVARELVRPSAHVRRMASSWKLTFGQHLAALRPPPANANIERL